MKRSSLETWTNLNTWINTSKKILFWPKNPWRKQMRWEPSRKRKCSSRKSIMIKTLTNLSLKLGKCNNLLNSKSSNSLRSEPKMKGCKKRSKMVEIWTFLKISRLLIQFTRKTQSLTNSTIMWEIWPKPGSKNLKNSTRIAMPQMRRPRKPKLSFRRKNRLEIRFIWKEKSWKSNSALSLNQTWRPRHSTTIWLSSKSLWIKEHKSTR